MTIQHAESRQTGAENLHVNPVAGDAHDQAALVHSGDTAPIELVRRAIERAERLNPAINAISHRAYSEACRRAESLPRGVPMRGVPYLAKDSLQYVGMPSKCGSRLLAAALPETRQHAFADRLDAAGLVAIGKSTVPEFALLPTTESTLYGDTRNPWAAGRSAGGSSGGAAAAVAAGIVPVAHGSDGGGSIRIPASCCGLPGLKPSRGANVRARDFHLVEDILVGDGLLARSVRDLAWFARLLRPDDALQRPVKRQLRIALCLNDTLNMAPHPEVADVVTRAANLCRQLGHEVEIPSRLPASTELVIPTFRALWSFLARDLVEGLQRNAPATDVESMLEPSTIGFADAGRRLSPNALAEVYRAIGEVDRAMCDFFRQYDVLLSPVVSEVPPLLGHLSPRRAFDALAQDLFTYIGYTPLANLAGLPSMSLPLFPSASDLPVGAMFTAARGGDELLLSLAAELEAAEPWGRRWPLLAPA